MTKILEEEAMKIGYTIVVGSSGEDYKKFDKLINFFIDQQVDGLILAPVENSENSFLKLNEIKFPYITIDRHLNKINSKGIKLNNKEISYLATKTLIQKGAKFPLLISYKTTLMDLVDRDFGFYEALKEYNLFNIGSIKVRVKEVQKDVHAGLEKYFSRQEKPDAIYFTSNKLALFGLRYLLKNNINIPEDVQIIAFDESDAYGLFSTEISYIKQPLDDIIRG